jgi:cell division protease FtsH
VAVKKLASNVWVWVVVGVLVGGGIFLAVTRNDGRTELRLDQYRTSISDGRVATATILDKSNRVEGTLKSGEQYTVTFPADYADDLTTQLLKAGVHVKTDGQSASTIESLVVDLLPTLLIVGVFLWFVMQMQGGGRMNRFGRAKARRHGNEAGATFADVAGADEAVEELQEIKEFLRDPERFRRLGARIPKGVLLFGPPGTGKTLLARAVAGEADVPFLTISGSDFVEMFVGVGAARVRDLFRQAKDMAPAIIFVDEIDAVGRHRGAGVGGGHDEREQTLNQMLVEMDGFDTDSNVILMAATNRPDILDPALLRPGRFDRQIAVDAPDLHGREAILSVHARGKPFTQDVNLSVVARRTPGFTGADLANIVNEAALLAGRRSVNVISMNEVSEAIDRVMAGPERRSLVMSEKEKAVTAYHEAGHALVGHALPTSDPVHKVSIVARGRALGFTLSLPTEDRYTRTRQELIDRLAMYMGGLSAEELVFDERTTGAADDIDRATKLARAMVTEYGMSVELGPQRLTFDDEPTRLREAPSQLSEEVAAAVDGEVKRLLDDAHRVATEVLTLHRATLDLLASRLIEQETLDEEELREVFAGVGR